jgi:hypothetical protein
MPEKALTADKTLEESVVEETEETEEVVEPQETTEEPAKPEETAVEPEPETYLIDEGDIRFRDTEAVVKSIQNARQELIKRSRENRAKDTRIAELTRSLADMERQLKAPQPTLDTGVAGDELDEALKQIAPRPADQVDFDEYQQRVQSAIGTIAKVLKSGKTKPVQAEPETTAPARPQAPAIEAQALGATERHILVECEALQVEHPELYDFDQAKLYDIMDDPFHPDRDKVTNVLEVMRLMGDGLTAERAHLVVTKRLEKKAGTKKPAAEVVRKSEPKSPQEEVLGDLRRGRQAITTRSVQAAAENTKKITTLQDALREMNQKYVGM